MSRALLLRELHLQDPPHNMKPDIRRSSGREHHLEQSNWAK